MRAWERPRAARTWVEIHQPAGWNNNHVVSAITEYDDRLGDLSRGQVLGRGNLARREGLGMASKRELG